MEWTMPRPVLQWVAGLLAAAALGAFVMGIVNAPERGGRLPGERVPGASAAAGASVINATEATPLTEERIETAPKPAAKATNTDEGDDEPDAAANATNATPPAKATNATPTPALQTTAPPSATPATPPEDEPPH